MGRSLVAAFGRAIRNPVVGLFISSALSVVLYLLSGYEMRPSLTISSSEVVASKSNGAADVRITYAGTEVDTIRRVTIVIWNAGDKPIERSAISTDQPICIQIPASVQVLSRRVTRVSRATLRMHVSPDGGQAGTCIPVWFEGDDALERNDGAAVELLYDGPENAAFGVQGRIKGVPKGFSPIAWERAIKKRKELKHWLFLIQFVCLTGIGAHMLSIEIRRARNGEPNNIVFGSFSFIPVTCVGIYLAIPLFFGLSWVSR